MAVPILINEIFRRYLTNGAEPLRAPRPHPDKVASRDWIPRVAQPVNTTSLEHNHRYRSAWVPRSCRAGHSQDQRVSTHVPHLRICIILKWQWVHPIKDL